MRNRSPDALRNGETELQRDLRTLTSLLPPNPKREWRDVPGFEGVYVASNYGHVGSLSRRCSIGRGYTRLVRVRLLKATVRMRKGAVNSMCVALHQEGGPTFYATPGHVVLLAFVGAPTPSQVAHYKDGDPSNGSLENMEWSTYTEIAITASNGGYRSDLIKQKRLL